MLDLKVGVPEGPSARPLFFPGRKDTQVPECPSARLEMLDLKVGVPEGPSALPFFSGRKIGSVPKYPSARPFPSPEERYKITAHIRKNYQQKNQVPKCPGRPSARSLHPTPIISHIYPLGIYHFDYFCLSPVLRQMKVAVRILKTFSSF